MKNKLLDNVFPCLICVILLIISLIPVFIDFVKPIMNKATQVAHTENGDEYNTEFNRFMDDAENKNDILRQSLMAWSLSLLTLLAMAAFATVYFNRKGIRMAGEKLDQFEADLREDMEKQKMINKYPLGELSLLTRDEMMAFMNEKHLDVLLKAESANKRCKFPSCKQCDIFSDTITMYENGGDVNHVLEKLKKMDKKYKECQFKINHFIGFIYNDDIKYKNESTEKRKDNYEKAVYYYRKCLDIDALEEEKFILVVYNDLGYAEMRLADLETEKEKQEELYKSAKDSFDRSVDILKNKNLNWPNPYKNMGECLGKLALLEKDDEKKENLFIQAESWYHMAYATNLFIKYFAVIHESFMETKMNHYKSKQK